MTSLHLIGTKITDAGLQHLQGMNRLLDLALDNTRITDAGLRTLAQQSHPQLADLGLSGTRVTDAGMSYVGQFKELAELDLNDQITDAGLRSLLPLKRLEALSIERDDGLSDVGLAYIGQFSGLTALSIESNRLTDAGMANFKRLSSLRSLVLGSDRVTDAGLVQLAALKQLLFLTLRCGRITDAGLRNLRGLASSKGRPPLTLSVRGDQITGDGLAGMYISCLTLAGSKFTDDALNRISDIHELQSLNLLGPTSKEPA